MREVLIIDNDIDFCSMMCYYFSKKNIKAYYSTKPEDGLKLFELKKPEIVIASRYFENIERSLHEIINTTDDYDPDVFMYDANPRVEKVDLLDDIGKLIKWIIDKFR